MSLIENTNDGPSWLDTVPPLIFTLTALALVALIGIVGSAHDRHAQRCVVVKGISPHRHCVVVVQERR